MKALFLRILSGKYVLPKPLVNQSLLTFFCTLLFSVTSLAENNQNDLEYRIKAAYLYNLSKFIEWPEAAETPNEPIEICLYQSNPFSDYIYKLEERTARGRSIKIINKPSTRKIAICDIIFIPASNKISDNLLTHLQKNNVLTVGESDLFLKQGGLISLTLINGRVQLSINSVEAKKQGFNISANLLEIARRVE